MSPQAVQRSRSHSAGFSLVEVALALAVVSFAFVGVMGLLPVGMSQFREAMDTTVGAQIFQRVLGDVQQADLDGLVASASERVGDFYALPTRYFDEQGSEVQASDPAGLTAAERERVLYEVRVWGALPGRADVSQHEDAQHTSLPAVGGVRHNPRDSTFINVQIAKNPTGRALPVDGRQMWDGPRAARMGVPVRSYPAIVTRNGYPRLVR